MSDATDMSIIILLIFMLIIYMFYVTRIISAKYDVNNTKCDPLNLFLNSINSESSESIDNFAECVNLLSPSTIPSK
jgi:hypothetical protein